MRELDPNEVVLISGGNPPLGSPTAGSYFLDCMNYITPGATTGAIVTVLASLPVIGSAIAAASLAFVAGTAAVCGLGTIQYAQK